MKGRLSIAYNISIYVIIRTHLSKNTIDLQGTNVIHFVLFIASMQFRKNLYAKRLIAAYGFANLGHR